VNMVVVRLQALGCLAWLCAACSGEGAAPSLEDAGDPATEIDGGIDAGEADAAVDDAEPIPSSEYTPGSRLRPMFAKLADTEVFDGWYDMELEAPCQFLPTAAGERCVPGQTMVLYRNASCSEPVLAHRPADHWVPGGDGAPRYGLVITGGPCAGHVDHIFERGAALTSPPEALHYMEGGACRALPVEQLPAYQVFEVSAELNPTALVAQTGIIRAGEERLRASYRQASDGSVERLGYHDFARGQRCDAARDEQGLERCMPALGHVAGQTYVDPTCTETATLVGFLCETSEFAARWVSDGCDAMHVELVHLDVRRPDYVFEGGGGACFATMSEYYEVWDVTPITGDQFPEMLPATYTTGRFQVRVEHAAGLPDHKAKWAGQYFRDAELNTLCRPTRAADGRWRCLPYNTWSGHFRDAKCALPVQREAAQECSEVDFVTQYDGEQRSHVFEAGAALEAGVALFEQTELGCTAARAGDAPVYSLTEVDPATFAEVTSETR
jgi:hypothetical protein